MDVKEVLELRDTLAFSIAGAVEVFERLTETEVETITIANGKVTVGIKVKI